MLKYIIIALVILFNIVTNAQDKTWITELNGYWKFSVGDKEEWKNKNFNDNGWEDIRVPSSWEDQGFYGYNGYGWYRKSFEVPATFRNKTLYVSLGYVDDVDEVYINGKLVGFSGEFPPRFETAYSAYREYPVPAEYLDFNGKNILAVRVYDDILAGGITGGETGIFTYDDLIEVDINLAGKWSFIPGDNLKFADPGFDISGWDTVMVPANWETQGYTDYDGFAWYRKTFKLKGRLKSDKLVLLLGKIDDIDQVYLNGKFVGSTGRFGKNSTGYVNGEEWDQLRGYLVDSDKFDLTGENTIAVRVYDSYKGGGIYMGPVGITSQDNYINYWREQKKSKSLWNIIFDNLK